MNIIRKLKAPIIGSGDRLFTPASCIMDVDEKYRFSLSRRWIAPYTNRPPECDLALGVMLNPSKADALNDDATIRRWIAFVQSWGLAGFDILNLYAWRSTDPKKLFLPGSPYLVKEVGTPYPDMSFENKFLIEAAEKPYAKVIFAWGGPGKELVRDHQVGRMMWNANRRIEPMCFGFNADGSPKHPLRLAKTTQLVPYRERPS